MLLITCAGEHFHPHRITDRYLIAEQLVNDVLRNLRPELSATTGVYGGELFDIEDAAAAKPALERLYDAFSELLRVRADEVAYVENATRSWDMAFYALPLEEGDRIITHASEYASNYLAFLHLANRRGAVPLTDPSLRIGVGLNAAIGRVRRRLT